MLIFNVLTRVFVLFLGVTLQIAIAVWQPSILRLVQKWADVAGDAITNSLPDTFAVWTGVIGLDTLLVHLVFILIAIVIVEIVKSLFTS